MLSNAYLLAKFRFDTAENERNFAEFLPKTDNYLRRDVHELLRRPGGLGEADDGRDAGHRAGEHLAAVLPLTF